MATNAIENYYPRVSFEILRVDARCVSYVHTVSPTLFDSSIQAQADSSMPVARYIPRRLRKLVTDHMDKNPGCRNEDIVIYDRFLRKVWFSQDIFKLEEAKPR